MMVCDRLRSSRRRWLHALLASCALLCATPVLAQTIIGTGNVTPVPGSSPWNITGNLIVGSSGTGTLIISGGGQVSNTYGYIGLNANSNGTVTVDGLGSRWTNTELDVGNAGTGTLNITAGGIVSDMMGVIGTGASGNGTVTVDGLGSQWTNSSFLEIGAAGKGALKITAGGVVSTNLFVILGVNAGSSGVMTVSGSGSRWSDATFLTVARSGIGTLEITDGGVVSTANGFIGGDTAGTGGTGTMTVSGSGSQWNGSGTLAVGFAGTGTLTISDAGTVSAATGTGIANAAGSNGKLIIGAAAGQAATAPGTLVTPTVTFGAGKADLVFNHTDTSGDYVFGAAITGGSATTSAVDVYAGTTVMTGVGSDYFGRTTVYDGAVLAAGAANVFSPNSDYFLQDPGTLNLNGFSQTVGSLTNAGFVNMGTGTAPGAILTVNGNYVGNGGVIAFNTVLGSDNSLTDKLIVNGDTSGQTDVKVTNAGGLGAQTTGNGIELVHVGGASGGAFDLTGRVAAGAYDYNLFKGGIGADAGNGNWYLRSETRPEVPDDVVVPEEASHLGLVMLATASLRGSDASLGQFCADDVTSNSGLSTNVRPANPQCNTLLWGRMLGETGSAGGGVGSNGGFGSAGPAYTYDYGGFQAGADLYRTTRDSVGLYAGAITARSDVKMPNGGPAGSVGMNAYGVGGYWTHHGVSGWYTDLVLQGSLYDNIHARSVEGENFNTQGWGITASAEAGYQVGLGNGYSVIPQGQLVYQRTSIDGGTDQFARISYSAPDEIYGRFGARFAKGWLTNDSRVVTTWAEANFWHQFGEDAKTMFTTLEGANPATFATSLGGTWAQIRLGLTGQLMHNVSVFGDADYNIALANQHGHSLSGRAGIRVAW